MKTRGRWVVGNWKSNGGLATNALLLSALRDVSEEVGCAVAVCVPYPYLAQAQAGLAGSPVALGAQDVSEFDGGAYTGEVSARMLVEFGCRFAIVGHSERRTFFGDTSERVALKAELALAAGLTPIVCIGETLAEREQGRAVAIVTAQLDAVVERIGIDAMARTLVAYEPVWAIGTGKTASPAEAQAMHAAIRGHLAASDEAVAEGLVILYGGSVKASNAASLFGCDDIDGGLIGGASLVAEEFMGIVAAARRSTATAAAGALLAG